VHIGLASSGFLVEGNRVEGGDDDAIETLQSGDYGLHQIGANSVYGSGDLGILVADNGGSPAAIDLGGNQSRTGQCVRISCDYSGRRLMGAQEHGASFSPMSAEAKRASPFPAWVGARGVNRISAFIDGGGAASGSQLVRALLYGSAPGGGPGQLLGRSFQGTVHAGAPGRWVNFYLPFRLRLDPGVYWLGLQSGQTGGVARFAWTLSPTSR
jgi:hypothetical protein